MIGNYDTAPARGHLRHCTFPSIFESCICPLTWQNGKRKMEACSSRWGRSYKGGWSAASRFSERARKSEKEKGEQKSISERHQSEAKHRWQRRRDATEWAHFARGNASTVVHLPGKWQGVFGMCTEPTSPPLPCAFRSVKCSRKTNLTLWSEVLPQIQEMSRFDVKYFSWCMHL